MAGRRQTAGAAYAAGSRPGLEPARVTARPAAAQMKQIPEDVLAAITAKILPALAYMHAHHMVRRTMPPAGRGAAHPPNCGSHQRAAGHPAPPAHPPARRCTATLSRPTS